MEKSRRSLDPPACWPAVRCGPGRDLGREWMAAPKRGCRYKKKGYGGGPCGPERTGDQRRGAKPGVSCARSARINRQKALDAALGGWLSVTVERANSGGEGEEVRQTIAGQE